MILWGLDKFNEYKYVYLATVKKGDNKESVINQLIDEIYFPRVDYEELEVVLDKCKPNKVYKLDFHSVRNEYDCWGDMIPVDEWEITTTDITESFINSIIIKVNQKISKLVSEIKYLY